MEPLAEFKLSANSNNPNLLVPCYLVASYMYYRYDESLISDAEYDELCRKLIANWNRITHPHKHFIDLEQLKCGSGFAISFDELPRRVLGSAKFLYSEKQKPPRQKMIKRHASANVAAPVESAEKTGLFF